MATGHVSSLVCFSHKRWSASYHRPQHLMRCFARTRKVIFIEDAVACDGESGYDVSSHESITRVVPKISRNASDHDKTHREVIDGILNDLVVNDYIAWFTSPVAFPILDLRPHLTIYDCMEDAASSTQDAASFKRNEAAILAKADLVFTAGYCLYETKKNSHPRVFPFPNGIDVDHFYQARYYGHDPVDQTKIAHPRIGYFGQIDERIDFTLLNALAVRKPDWHFIMVGRVVDDVATKLPRYKNIHYLDEKQYADLPSYLAGWDVTMIPFNHSAMTRNISPLKTGEYIAGGKPVIATPIIDVIRQYGRAELVHIAGTPDEFIRTAETEFLRHDRSDWFLAAQEFLAHNTWEIVFQRMDEILAARLSSAVEIFSSREILA